MIILEELFTDDDGDTMIYDKTPSGEDIGRVAKIYHGNNHDKVVKLLLNSEKMLEILKGFTRTDSEIMLIDFKSQAEELINEIEQ